MYREHKDDQGQVAEEEEEEEEEEEDKSTFNKWNMGYGILNHLSLLTMLVRYSVSCPQVCKNYMVGLGVLF